MSEKLFYNIFFDIQEIVWYCSKSQFFLIYIKVGIDFWDNEFIDYDFIDYVNFFLDYDLRVKIGCFYFLGECGVERFV